MSMYFGKRSRENQSVMKKSMIRICITSGGDEYFELNKDEPETILSSKNHTGSFEGTEDHSDGNILAMTNSPKCPVKTIRTSISHLNPSTDRLF